MNNIYIYKVLINCYILNTNNIKLIIFFKKKNTILNKL